MTENNYYRKAACLLTLLLCLLFLREVARAEFNYEPPYREKKGYETADKNHVVAKILSVLEARRTDPLAIDKLTRKLHSMEPEKLHLIASLCDRISAKDGAKSSNLTFSLMTTMIVLL